MVVTKYTNYQSQDLQGIHHKSMQSFALQLSLALLLLPCLITPLAAQARLSNGIAMHGEPKYGADFTHFDYAFPLAPKGGRIRLAERGTFDSFNAYIPKGNPAAGIASETLLTASEDEAFSGYGLLAESIDLPDDRSWVTFTLRKEAHWHDGQPISVADVIWSLELLKSHGSPFFRFYYASVTEVKQVGERKVKFIFSERGNRELPLIVGQLPILPKHYWQDRDFTKTTLEPPLGSGPYRVKTFEAGRFVTLERVRDYWGESLPVRRGTNNFDEIRYNYYRDTNVIRQALKAGEIDYFDEHQSKAWALGYDIPAVRKGLLKKEALDDKTPTGMQAFVFNTRRAIFSDRRVRQALGLAFDFQWTNKNLFFGQYARNESYFANSELASRGLPDEVELKILEPFRDRLPAAVFTEPYRAPRTNGNGWPRENLRQSFALLHEAGWEVGSGHGSDDKRLRDVASGEPMRFEILLGSPTLERPSLPFTRNLKRLGIDVSVRVVDQSQYINRLRDYDFDLMVYWWQQTNSPGNEQRGFWGSEAAKSPGGRNFAGISDPVVDELIESLIVAPDRQSLITRTRALDRVLLHGHYVIPNWHSRHQKILYWDKFSRPATNIDAGTAISYWWYDAVKAVRLAAALAPVVSQEAAQGLTGNTTIGRDSVPASSESDIRLGSILLAALALAGAVVLVFLRTRRHSS